jgi:hypothetical protein
MQPITPDEDAVIVDREALPNPSIEHDAVEPA